MQESRKPRAMVLTCMLDSFTRHTSETVNLTV